MKKFLLVTVLLVILLSVFSTDIAFGKTIEERVEILEDFSGKIDKATDSVVSISNISLEVIGALLAVISILLAIGFFETRIIIKRRVNDHITEQVQANGKKFFAEILGISQEDLEKEFLSILKKEDYHQNLLNLLSPSENIQARGISYFITNPKEDPLVISFLTKYEDSKNPALVYQSLLARESCGDQTAKAERQAAPTSEGTKGSTGSKTKRPKS